MFAIVGLGNPGARYDSTRHNIGFEVIDLLARNWHLKVNKIKHKALIGETLIGGERVLLVKPQTYMNLSGEALRSLVTFYKIPMEQVLVIYDDVDLSVGQVRIRMQGSSGTHNGMRSIVQQLQSENFPRIRIGIGKSDRILLADYVLQRFSSSEIPVMEAAATKAAEAVECFISQGIQMAMNRYNGV